MTDFALILLLQLFDIPMEKVCCNFSQDRKTLSEFNNLPAVFRLKNKKIKTLRYNQFYSVKYEQISFFVADLKQILFLLLYKRYCQKPVSSSVHFKINDILLDLHRLCQMIIKRFNLLLQCWVLGN